MIKPPLAPIKPYFDKKHNIDQPDNYYWLRERENQEVIDYLNAENEYTTSVMESTEALQKKLYDEMIGRIKENDLSVPVKKGDYFYYSRTEEGKNYPIYCRKLGSLDAEEVIILDGNVLAEGKEYFRLGSLTVSENQKLLAYSADFNGSEYYDIYVKNLETNELLEDFIPQTAGSIVWANDNKTLFYNTLDETHRPYRLYRHYLGNSPEKAEMVYEEKDGGFFMSPYKTKSKGFICIYTGSKVTSEVHLLDANNPSGDFKCFCPREEGIEYGVYHHDERFYILTNENALNFKLMQTALDNWDKTAWTSFIEHDEQVMLNNLEVFRNYLVIYNRKNGFKNITVLNLKTNQQHDIEFPEPVYTCSGEENPNYDTEWLRFSYNSLISPNSVFDYNLTTKERKLLKEQEVLGGYDKSDYISERASATAADGTEIPLSIVYKKGFKKDGTQPVVLYGYGSYGANSEPYFSSLRVSLLDRGFAYVTAHIRGGSEMGRVWYENGKFLNKKNTFNDFIAAAEFLHNNNYVAKDKLIIRGGSAGGLLVGTCMNMRPDLFKGVAALVPFVDVMNTMLDETIPLTVAEYVEWGNPNESEYYDYMKSYSPYDNIEKKDYPNVLITAGLNDPRVQYWEPAKWCAKLRVMKTDDNLLLLKTNMGAGHGGASGRYESIKEIAFEYAFMIKITE